MLRASEDGPLGDVFPESVADGGTVYFKMPQGASRNTPAFLGAKHAASEPHASHTRAAVPGALAVPGRSVELRTRGPSRLAHAAAGGFTSASGCEPSGHRVPVSAGAAPGRGTSQKASFPFDFSSPS